MTNAWRIAGNVLVACTLLACGGKGKPPATASAEPSPWSDDTSNTGGAAPAATADSSPAPSDAAPSANERPLDTTALVPGTEEGARKLLAQFVGPNADHATLSRSLRPTSADYAALFDAEAAAKIEADHAKEWDSGKMVIRPEPGQTDVKLAAATSTDLAMGSGAANALPGGYKKIVSHLTPGVTYYAFRFVEPGKKHGMAYDGLAFVNGHWVLAPKPWRSLADEPAPEPQAKRGADAAKGPKPGKPGKAPKGAKKTKKKRK